MSISIVSRHIYICMYLISMAICCFMLVMTSILHLWFLYDHLLKIQWIYYTLIDLSIYLSSRIDPPPIYMYISISIYIYIYIERERIDTMTFIPAYLVYALFSSQC